MKRLFSAKQKRYLAILSGGKCAKCDRDLPRQFHGDHVVAFCYGGKTTLSNGQALCPRCNLRKGKKRNEQDTST